MGKRALVTGCTGQDGFYLSEFLLQRGYTVVGLKRRSTRPLPDRLKKFEHTPKFSIEEGDVTDLCSISNLISKIKPDEVYNLAAQSHVAVSFEQPFYTFQATGLGAMNILESIRTISPNTKFYQASSSEMFGKSYDVRQTLAPNIPVKYQSENTHMMPQSPYAIAKLAAHHMVRLYRDAYNIFACSGVLFNHESCERGEQFVTRKITKWIGEFHKWWNGDQLFFEDPDYIREYGRGRFPKLRLGNLDASRDWGHAKDYCINLDVPILTTSGWKFNDEISIGDEIINFDTKNHCLSIDQVNEKYLVDTNGEKIILTGRGVYLNVCSNHRIIYQQRSKKSKGGWSDYKELTALEFYELFKDKSMRSKYDYRLMHFQNYNKVLKDIFVGDEVLNQDIVYLVGVLLAEGCLSRHKKGNGFKVSISQSLIANEKIHKKIQECIINLKLDCSLYNKNNGVTEWSFSSESSKRILSWFDTPNIHIMPSWCYSLDQAWSEILVNSMMDCDGYWDGMVYTSKRYKLAVDFQTLACIAGYRTTKLRMDKSGIYTVNLITKSKKHQYIQEVKRFQEDVSKVWCVNTNNGTMITRDNNCISISGNCKAMWLMLQHDKPDDYVISTGETHSVYEFVSEAFKYSGIYDDPMNYIVVDPKFYRPAEVDYLLGDSSKARCILDWSPEYSFKDLVKEMVDNDS